MDPAGAFCVLLDLDRVAFALLSLKEFTNQTAAAIVSISPWGIKLFFMNGPTTTSVTSSQLEYVESTEKEAPFFRNSSFYFHSGIQQHQRAGGPKRRGRHRVVQHALLQPPLRLQGRGSQGKGEQLELGKFPSAMQRFSPLSWKKHVLHLLTRLSDREREAVSSRAVVYSAVTSCFAFTPH